MKIGDKVRLLGDDEEIGTVESCRLVRVHWGGGSSIHVEEALEVVNTVVRKAEELYNVWRNETGQDWVELHKIAHMHRGAWLAVARAVLKSEGK